MLFHAAGARAEPAHGIAMHGKLKYGPGFTHFDYVNPDAPKGGTVRLADQGTFDSFNGFIAKGNAAPGIGGIYDSLMAHAADEPFSEYGLLAESVETPPDRSWVRFRLRPEARWHDGKPITADDVVWTFNTLVEQGQPFYRFYYGSVEKAEAEDARTVKFTFKPGDNRELPLIMGELTVLPRHYWEGRDFAKTSLEPPLGSGPYRVEEFEPGRWITYVRDPDYWGRDLPVNVGTNNFERIRYDMYRNEIVMVEALKAGAYDFRSENSSKNWATAYNIPAVDKGLLVKLEAHHNRPQGMQGFFFNLRRPMFQDRRVRAALGYAFDFEWSNRNLFYGQYTRTRSYFDNSDMAATGLPGPEELKLLEPYRGRIPDEVFTQEYNPPKTEGDGRIRDNLRVADRLLKEAGWVIKDKKRVNAKTGEPLAFEILLVMPAFERISLPYAKNLQRLGVDVTVRTVDSSQYIERRRAFDYDVITNNFGQSFSPGNEQRDFWGSESAKRRGGRNFAGIQDPVVDELVEKLIAAPDRDSLVARCRALDRVLQWGYYAVPHWHITYDRLVFWDKFGRPAVTPLQGTVFGSWWVLPDAEERMEREKKGLQPAKE
ncbi:MAG: ABC transporter substrate-binding protein [Hyphomicrobiales bacterium]|nr:ABC transporter substrate-binding protein [Hyphomicrobiales bacterium]MCP5374175.1 ABC transporter substrate-binding protein [Hyphomicrobiales bacterium]